MEIKPFKVSQSSTGMWVAQGPDGDLRSSNPSKQMAQLDARRLNAAWNMGFKAGADSVHETLKILDTK